jgi:dTDP-4-dehydrorhamnose 3,5-epimerase
MMRIAATAIPDVLLVESDVLRDDRGFFSEIFHAEKFRALGLPVDFVQDNHSRSMRNSLRGLHYQLRQPQGKLVRVVSGAIFDVAVDLRRSSSTFGRWTAVTLNAGDGRQLWIPPGFAHGFLALSKEADVTYKCTAPYDHASDRCIAWNDPEIAIAWPLDASTAPILSSRDAVAPCLSEAELFA